MHSWERLMVMLHRRQRQELWHPAQTWWDISWTVLSIFGTPPAKKDTDKWERIQRRATGVIRDLESMTYMEKLKEIHLFSLEKRQAGKDMIRVKCFLTKMVINWSQCQLKTEQEKVGFIWGRGDLRDKCVVLANSFLSMKEKKQRKPDMVSKWKAQYWRI